MGKNHAFEPLPVPPFYDAAKVSKVWKVPYQERAQEARAWADEHDIRPMSEDEHRIGLLLIDVQNTFCIPGYELFVGGRSGTGAVDDNRRLSEFIYRNLGSLHEISATMDTHQAMQIFHAIFLVDEKGAHPEPMTLVTVEDVREGRWKFNRAIAESLGISPEYGQEHLLHYTAELQNLGKYELTIWPYHAMLGGIGHALVSTIEEALFFHTIARYAQADMILKGSYELTESYSAIGPEVQRGPQGDEIARKSGKLFEKVRQLDALIVAGQAKSHCVAWTLDDILSDIQEADQRLAQKIYLLEDCTSPVVVPGVVDYTEQADAAFEKFADAGMRRVRSTDPILNWPGFPS